MEVAVSVKQASGKLLVCDFRELFLGKEVVRRATFVCILDELELFRVG